MRESHVSHGGVNGEYGVRNGSRNGEVGDVRKAGKCGVEVASVGVGAGRWEVEGAKSSRWWTVAAMPFCHGLTHRDDYGLWTCFVCVDDANLLFRGEVTKTLSLLGSSVRREN